MPKWYCNACGKGFNNPRTNKDVKVRRGYYYHIPCIGEGTTGRVEQHLYIKAPKKCQSGTK